MPAGDTGIRALLCKGPAASCSINVTTDDSEVRHVFAVEPVITTLSNDESDLRVGDALVAIDSLLITTVAGGARLAQLKTGELVHLLVRRDNRLRQISITAHRGCGVRSLRVTR